MSWTSIPNFGDKLAKVNERTHSSGAKIIEVLYGARDEYGKPISPESSIDGHGHWIALEIDGTYQMLSWRHPDYDGGRQEYGRGRSSNALFDLEQDIAAKEVLCNRAESLSYSQDWSNASSSYKQLFEEWKKIYNWGTPKEKELWERFQSAKKAFYEHRDSNRQNNKIAKQNIIDQARNISSSSDWKSASQQFNALFDKWKSIGSAGKFDDDSLWNEFNSLRKEFYERRSKHYSEMDDLRAKNRQQKQALISEARSISEYSTDWKSTGDKLQELMERWKKVGSAGKDYDDKLWNEFNSVRQSFYNRRHTHYEQQDSVYKQNASRKSQLVQEATSIASRCEYSSQSTERMKALGREWKNIGFAGKEDNDRLWELFRNANDSFWAGKKTQSAQKQQEWRTKTNAAISRKREQISNLENQISKLRMKMIGMRNQDYINNIYGWISEKEGKIRDLESDIRDMESKL